MSRFVLVLHAHIPYVRRHGLWPFGAETLFEVMAESYLPLAQMLEQHWAEGLRAPLTLGLTPILSEQLADPEVKTGFRTYASTRLSAAHDDLKAYQETTLAASARHQVAFWENTVAVFEAFGGDLVGAFARAQAREQLELITSNATHGYTPLLGTQGAAVAQVRTGFHAHRRHFLADPVGYWLPEMGYRPAGPRPPAAPGGAVLLPGVDEVLMNAGLRYTFVDAHMVGGIAGGSYDQSTGVQKSSPSVFQVHELSSGLLVLARNRETAAAVWSADSGYPGHPVYQEFHKKDSHSGLRHWRVSGRGVSLDQKMPYEPEAARQQAQAHAHDFVSLLNRLAAEYPQGVITSAYDAELFGHWWHEGLHFLDLVLRGLAENKTSRLVPAHKAVRGSHTPISLSEGSWGRGGKHEVWQSPTTEDYWAKVYDAEHRMAQSAHSAQAGQLRPLRQMMRELLLLEASDWPFLIETGQAADWARERYRNHYERFIKVQELLDRGETGGAILEELELIDNPFPEANPRLYLV